MKTANDKKFIVTMLAAISSGGVLYIANHEGRTEKPIIPVAGDVPTIGHGTTVYCNGVKVTMNDKSMSKDEAFKQLKCYIDKNSSQFNKSLSGVRLSQKEYDLYADFSYQYGINAFKTSSMLRHLKTGNNVEACKSLLKWKFVAGRDCSIRKNNCYGVWTRQVERHNICMGENK